MVLQMGTPTDKIDTLFKFMKYYDKVESNLSVLVPRKSSKKWILFVYLHIHIIFFPAMKPENHFHLEFYLQTWFGPCLTLLTSSKQS
jgi:hypothetical protein